MRSTPPRSTRNPRPGELPPRLAERLAAEKAEAVAARHAGAFVLGADTVVACGRRILGKPETAAEARTCLTLLSGRRHRVHGGIALVTPQGKLVRRRVVTMVAMSRITNSALEAYLASNEWRGKAGGYAIQGLAARFVRGINGSYSNVVGLPLFETLALLEGQGFRR